MMNTPQVGRDAEYGEEKEFVCGGSACCVLYDCCRVWAGEGVWWQWCVACMLCAVAEYVKRNQFARERHWSCRVWAEEFPFAFFALLCFGSIPSHPPTCLSSTTKAKGHLHLQLLKCQVNSNNDKLGLGLGLELIHHPP